MANICDAPACEASAGGQEPRRCVRLCAACHSRLASQLSGLPALYRGCERLLEHRRQRPPERIRGWKPSGISLNYAAVTVRSNISEVLASWCAMIIDERGVAGPRDPDIEHLTAFLTCHMDWLAGHVAAGDLAAEIAELVDAVRDVFAPIPQLQIELGPCAEAGCRRTVRATVRAVDESVVHQVSCEVGHVWQPHQWLMLGRWIEQAANRQRGGSRLVPSTAS